MSLSPDTLLRGRYRIVRVVQHGGMGAVYEAQDRNLADSPCAVKEILESAQQGKNAQYVANRFVEEMKALAGLDHPSIPRIRDFFEENDTSYIVMELIQGPSLAQELKERMASTGKPAAPEAVAKDILALLDTIAYLHNQTPAVIHRDIKPANILRDSRSGNIKLVDFGLARQMSSSTKTIHTSVGTVVYCAPEQMAGRAEPRSDLYSVGMTFYELLMGEPPGALAYEGHIPELPGTRPGLGAIVQKATQIRCGDRYASAELMAADLRRWLERGVVPASLTPERPSLVNSPGPQGVTLEVAPVAELELKSSRTLAGVAAGMATLVAGLFLGSYVLSPAPVNAAGPEKQPLVSNVTEADDSAPLVIDLAGEPKRPALKAQPPVFHPKVAKVAIHPAPPPPPKPAPVVVAPRIDDGPAYPTFDGSKEPIAKAPAPHFTSVPPASTDTQPGPRPHLPHRGRDWLTREINRHDRLLRRQYLRTHPEN